MTTFNGTVSFTVSARESPSLAWLALQCCSAGPAVLPGTTSAGSGYTVHTVCL